jgi:hypothetical protein
VRDVKRDAKALQWMDQEKIEGFSQWKAIEHPDFPGRRVEVGGFRPWWRSNPPADLLDDLAAKHHEFLISLCGLLPQLTIDTVKVESLGHEVYRITARIANTGLLPTSTQLGADARLTYPIQVELLHPKGITLVSQPRRHRHRVIAGGGSVVEDTWLIRREKQNSGQVTIRAASLMVGSVELSLSLDGES